MIFNVIGYDNQILGQVEAKDALDAWGKAGKQFEKVLDVRLVEEAEIPVVIPPAKKGVSVLLKGKEEEMDGEILALIVTYKTKWETEYKAPPGLISSAIDGAVNWAAALASHASPDLTSAKASFKYLMPEAMESRDPWVKSMVQS